MKTFIHNSPHKEKPFAFLAPTMLLIKRVFVYPNTDSHIIIISFRKKKRINELLRKAWKACIDTRVGKKLRNLPHKHQEYSQALRFQRHDQQCQFPMQLLLPLSSPSPPLCSSDTRRKASRLSICNIRMREIKYRK